VIFNQILPSTRTPGAFAEFDSSKARPTPTTKPSHMLIVGTKLSAGTMTVETVYELTGGSAQADALAGVGSPLAEMARTARKANPEARISLIASTEPSGGTLAAGSLAFTGTATADGYIYLYVGGILLTPLRVLSGATHTATATALYNAINADTRLPIVATNGTPGTVTLASKWKGVAANDVLVELNRLETQAVPTGLACTATTMASGAGVPVIATTIAAFGSEWYDRIVSQFNDDATMDALEAYALTTWDAGVALDAQVFGGYRGSYADGITYGTARNNQYSTVVDIELSPTTPWVAAANYAAVDAKELDAARPLNGLVLVDVVAPKKSQRFTRTQRDALLHYGMTTTKVGVNDAVLIERAITTYRLNAQSIADDTYLDLTTPKTLSYLRWNWNARLATKYPRHKLADDDTKADPDQPIITPKIGKGELLAWGLDMERAGLIEDYDTFESTAICERDLNDENPAGDPNRLNFFMSPDLVNGAHVFATKIGFIL
jgi:phage tail sheath gpL-like